MQTSEILDLAGKPAETVAKIEQQLFEVERVPVPSMRPGYDAPEKHYGIYKRGGGECFAVSGSKYFPLQPTDMLAAICTAAQDHGLDLSRLEYNERQGGKYIAFDLAIEPLEFKNAAGKIDNTEFKLEFSTGYDVKTSSKVKLYTWREICTNGMYGWGTDGAISVRNTLNGADKVNAHFNNFAKVLTNVGEYREKLIQLNSVKLTKKQIRTFAEQVLNFKKDNVSELTKRKLEEINALIDLEVSRAGRTAFAALQGVTNYTSHHKLEENTLTNEHYIKYGEGKKINDRAQVLAFSYL